MLRLSWEEIGEGSADDADMSFEITERSLSFDCVVSENHEGTADLSEHAVEQGSPISDHKKVNQRTVSIEALMTMTPLVAPEGVDGEVRENDAKANVLVFGSDFNRLQEAFDTLDELRASDTPITVSTKFRVYDALQLVRVQSPRETGDGDSLRFSLDFKAVRIAVSRTTDTPQSREPRGRGRQGRGDQEPEEASQRNQSALAAIRDQAADIDFGSLF